VGPSDGSEEPYLYESVGEEGTWITLSYQWGNEKNLMTTTKASLEERKKCMPFQHLPTTLQDAVIATRNLNVRYLWIDSVSIIQDCNDDWAQQSSEMAEIYSHSLVTIAASEAESCQSGFLGPRKLFPEFLVANPGVPANAIKTRYIIPSQKTAGDLWIEPPLQPYKLAMQRYRRTLYQRRNPLQRRGWVLQETLLSPRTLHYSTEQIFWQCRTCAFVEGDAETVEFNFWPWYDWQNEKTFLSVAGIDMASMQRRSPDGWLPNEEYYSIHTNWLRIVNEYTTRKLTYSSDTLPACSGIASRFYQLTNDQYLAGIWSGD
jgi:hypothetical protein